MRMHFEAVWERSAVTRKRFRCIAMVVIRSRDVPVSMAWLSELLWVAGGYQEGLKLSQLASR